MSYMCNRCSGWVHLKCSGLQNAAGYRRIKKWTCSSPHTPPIPQPLPSPITTKASDGDPFTILQFNANGIGNKQVELGEFLERHKVKVAVIQESKLTLNSRDTKHPELHHRKKRPSSRPRRWFTHIDSQINKLLLEDRFTRCSGRSSFGRVDYYSQAGKYRLDHYQCLHTPSKLLHRRIQSISGSSDDDFNAHHSSWYSSSTDSRGTMLESMVSSSNFGILNWDSPTRLPGNANPSSPDVSFASASLITSTNWQTNRNLGSDHLPILISLQMDVSINPIQHCYSINMKRQTGSDTEERLKTS